MSLDSVIQSQAARLGVPDKALKVVVLLFLSYPSALAFRFIPPQMAPLRHLFSIIVSATFYCSLFNHEGFIQLCASALLVYVLCALFRTKSWNPILVFLVTMGHLSYKYPHLPLLIPFYYLATFARMFCSKMMTDLTTRRQ